MRLKIVIFNLIHEPIYRGIRANKKNSNLDQLTIVDRLVDYGNLPNRATVPSVSIPIDWKVERTNEIESL